MQRRTLELVRCPGCSAGSLVPLEAVAENSVTFGPVHCVGCHARFPVVEGVVDLGAPATPSGLGKLVQAPWLARGWERYLRQPFNGAIALASAPLSGAGAAVKSLRPGQQERELSAVLAALERLPPGPLVDLGCGSGQLLAALSRADKGRWLIGVDSAGSMLDEAVATMRENALAADFLRAAVPPLPFLDRSLAGVVAVGLLSFVPEPAALLAEIARALRPAGRLVIDTISWHRKAAQTRAGLTAHPVEAIVQGLAAHGFIRVQSQTLGGIQLFVAERP